MRKQKSKTLYYSWFPRVLRISGAVFLLFVVIGTATLSRPSKSYADEPASTSVGDVTDTSTCNNDISDGNDCPIVGYLTMAINILSAAVGLVVVGVIIASGIQYSSAHNDPQALAKAKGRIYSAVIALIVYIFSWTFLQWVVPGGIFK